MERNRYPRRGQSCPMPRQENRAVDSPSDNCLCVSQPISLGISYTKKQTFGKLYSPCDGWRIGTIFPDLDKPYCAGGMRR
ncbi:MAG: spore coat associated protein CotJA [Clostridia bacterium]|nr:spore coat associated protein CotJA [Clostridia bacterium]